MKDFHIGSIITVGTFKLIAPEGMQGIQNILEFMTDGPVMTHEIPDMLELCKPYIVVQFPWLDDPEFLTMKLGELSLYLEASRKNGTERKFVILGWLGQFINKYGEYLPVKSITEMGEMR